MDVEKAPDAPVNVLPCEECGQPMTVPGLTALPPNLAVKVTCFACVKAAAAVLRKYEVRCQVVRVADPDAPDGEELMASFTAKAEALNLVAAVPALADGLVEKWEKFQESAAVAEADEE